MARRIVIHNHLPTRDASRFARGSEGGSGAYKCQAWCGKTTRETGLGESDLQMCKSCYSRSLIENAKSDYGKNSPEYKSTLAKYGKNVIKG